MNLLNLFLLLVSSYSFAQKSEVFRIDSIPQQGILLDKGWKWHAGDNPDFAKADFDDSAWEGIDPTKTIPQLNQIDKQKPLWLRTKLTSKSNKELVLSIVQSGASEIFLNGELIFSFGQIKKNNQSTVAYDPQNDAFVLKLLQQVNTLAVRYYFQDKLRYNSVYNINFPLFSATINNKVLKSDFRRHIWNGFNIGVPFILFIVHFIFFLFYPKNKANLWYSLASLFGFAMAYLLLNLEITHSVEYKNQLIIYSGALGVLGNSFSYYTIFLFLKQKNFWLVIVFVLGSILGVVLNYFDYFQSSVLFNYLLTAFYVSSVIYMGNHARKQGESGGKYLIVSMIVYIIFWTLFILSFTFGWGAISNDILFHLAALILPIIISALLGLDFRNTNNLLLKNLEKINIISAEKQQILSSQNETLEKQVTERTAELVHKNRDLEIESALERVRSRSMAMHKSEELVEVINVVAEQLLQLDFRLNTASFFLFDESEEFTFWLAAIGESNSNKIVIPKLNNPALTNIKEAQRKGLDFFADTLTFDEKNEWFQHVIDHSEMDRISEERKQYILNSAGYARSLVLMKEIGLFIVNYESIPYSDTENAIFKRFAKVFEQAYTRFLDLQKAEEQAREAQIEVALEKIRSRSLAMHHPDELKDVMEIMFQKMKDLDVVMGTIAIQFFDMETKASDFWVSNDLQNIAKVKQPYDEKVMSGNNYMVDCWAAKIKGENIINKLYTFQQKNEWFEYVFANNDFETIPQAAREFIMKAPNHVCTLIIEKNAALCADNWFGQYFSEDKIEILKRVAKVFEQAYIRFLDLQKAEAQAREGEIEVALERVRSRTMAMHKSEELREVVANIYEQLQKLGFTHGALAIVIFERSSGDSDWWMAGFGKENYPEKYRIPFFNHPFYLAQLHAWKEQKKYVELEVSGELKHLYDEFIFSQTDFAKIPNEAKKIMSGFEKIRFSNACMKHGALSWGTTPLEPEHEKILLRFANVFEQTYTRFLDLQKAEAQAREAQIEVALERVRSRSMAMHKSDEVLDVANTLYETLQNLGFQYGACTIMIMDKKTGDMEHWVAGFEHLKYPKSYHVGYFKNPAFDAQLVAWHNGETFLVHKLEGEEKREYDKKMFTQTEYENFPEKEKKWMSEAESVIFSLAYMKHGALHWGPSELSHEQVNILQRFAGVFEQSYTRFLDLQKAEEQAREAQIEVALEKIRARALAMHSSHELYEVAQTLRAQMGLLNQPELEASVIHLYDIENGVADSWHAYRPPGIESGEITSGKFQFRFEESALTKLFLQQYESNLEAYTIEAKGDILRDWAKILFEKSPDIKKYAGDKIPDVGFHHFSKFSGGALLMVTRDNPSEIVRYLQKRAASVFDFAYKRFLDLQKAEEQAREAQIEVSLERVRSRAMAMQRTSELGLVIGTVYSELAKLDLVLDRCFFMIFDTKTKGVTWWVASHEAVANSKGYYLPYHEYPPHLACLEAWKERKEKWQYVLEGEDKKSWDEYVFSETELSNLPDFIIENMKSVEKAYLSASYQNFGCLATGSFIPLTEESFDILRHFSKVFDLTYRRFNDLQKAEAQAREAQIEVALERVRARAMSMQKSDELADAAQILYHEFGKLGINTFTCGYMFIDETKQNQTAWVTLPDGTILPNYIDFPLTGDDVLDKRYASWKVKKPLHIHQVEGKENKTHHEFLAEHVPENVAKDIFDEIPESIIFYSSNFSNGYLLILAKDFFSQEEEQIIIRFTKVFELTYTRFLDLELAESQAREAQIEVALERVRSKTLAMQSSVELSTIIGLIFNEMRKLDVQLQRCFFMIFNPQNLGVTWWMASFESVDLGKGYFIPYSEHRPQLAYLKGWQERQETWRHHMQGEEKASWDAFLFNDTEFKTLPPFVIDNMKSFKSIHLEASFNSFGCLTTGNEQPLSEEAFDLLIRFSKVFDLTYTRFNDITVAEAQIREAQIEVAFERIRASALAMQTSDEFLGVVKTLYMQLNTLGKQELEATTIQFYDLEKGFINSWHAQNIDKLTEGNISLGTTQIPLDACELTLEWLEAYKSSLEDYTIVAKGEKLKEWLQLLVSISPEIKDRLGNSMPEISHFHFSEFSEGALSMVSLKPFSDESKYLLKRAASAFDLAYKRYLDLQLKEEQSLKLAEEKQRLEAALKKLKATQAQLIQSEKLASLGELTAGIAHEIQNPLNFVNNFSEVSIELANELSEALRQRGIEANSEEGELVSDLIQNQEKIHHHGKRASSIVKGMLEHSRKSTDEKEMTDINALAEEYLKLSYHGLRTKDHTFKSDFKTDFDIKLPKILVVPQDLGRVLLNLINNAFQAPSSPNGGAKLVIVKTQFLLKEGVKEAVLISVIDNGSGISPEIKSKIFQPFFTTKPTGEGTGLGLSLAYDIVTKGHGGTIECESVEGEGTEFIVKLPI